MKKFVSGLFFVVAMMFCSVANAQNYQQMADQTKIMAQQSYSTGSNYYLNTVVPAYNQIYTNAPVDANDNILPPKQGWSNQQVGQYMMYINQAQGLVNNYINCLNDANNNTYYYNVNMDGSTYADGTHNPGANDYYAAGNYYLAYVNYQGALERANQRFTAFQNAYSCAVGAGQAFGNANTFYNNNP